MDNQVLVVEDDIISMKLFNAILNKYGFSVLKATNGAESIESLMNNKIAAAILDLTLPDTSGFEILKYIRNHPIHKNIAILIVTVNHDKLDTILGLEMGADDYITKPFHHRELVARLNASIRRSQAIEDKTGPIIAFHDLKIDIEKRIIKKNNNIINFSFKEFEILYLLASNPGKVIHRQTILDKIGGLDYSPDTRVVDMHISSIRKKLGDTKKQKHYIDTVSGIGYRFRE
ncbi:response regulator transcription factor [Tissierella carlieri]|uniref:Response regulator transcription factor n=1 Tax=Tissierella carlieri TaxID=689904 RepID=A0ABT1S8Y5_9FIRM|nr:response regulator transcription factor [Tissierella carlieri]MCQ4922931.1 response regulator transcription factor [Tissierella carlieri]